jgi:putative chitinase
MIPITPELFLKLAPNSHLSYRKAFDYADTILTRYEINATPLRLAHWFAQMAHESGGFRLLVEDLDYRTAERIRAVWPSRFKNLAAAAPYLRNPQKLAEKVYGGRNGNTQPGDGFLFRGRAVPMLTFRDNYRVTGKRLGLDLEKNPDLVLEPANILLVAADFWAQKNCNALADADRFAGEDEMKNSALIAVTKKVNGGTIGLDDRARWLKKVKAALS